jgi:glyoxylase-like metal-dependent hydrolase (beta-lactamase superfamily II)
VDAKPLPDVLTLQDGTRLRAIPAPGHADDMVCYLAEEHGILFTADLFLSRRPQYLRFDEHVHRLIESLHRVLEHDFDTVLCGHRGRIADGRAALREKARYLEALAGVVRRRRRSDKRSVAFIRKEMLGREGWLYWVSGGDFSKRNLILSCLDVGTDEPPDEGEIVRP